MNGEEEFSDAALAEIKGAYKNYKKLYKKARKVRAKETPEQLIRRRAQERRAKRKRGGKK